MKAKYKIGQTIFHMCDNMVYEEQVIAVAVSNKGDVYYQFGTDGSHLEGSDEMGKLYNWTIEGEVFPTKADLIKSL